MSTCIIPLNTILLFCTHSADYCIDGIEQSSYTRKSLILSFLRLQVHIRKNSKKLKAFFNLCDCRILSVIEQSEQVNCQIFCGCIVEFEDFF